MDVVVRTLDRGDAPGLYALFQSHEGWDWRKIEDVRAAVANAADAVGLVDTETGELVAAARILTDFVFYARIYDVIVAADHCGQGLGTRLLEAVVERPAVTETKRVTLSCDERLVGFYEQVGFAVEETDGDEDEEGSVLMVLEGDEHGDES
jgi:predicted GNAT family N-acyltransferase